MLWQTTSRFADNNCDWAGPSIHDLDDDGIPEILFYGNVYDANGNALDETLGATVDAYGNGYLPVAADIDHDGKVELVTGSRSTNGTRRRRNGDAKRALPGPSGHIAVADFGTFPRAAPMIARTSTGSRRSWISSGVAHVFTVDGREVFTANLMSLYGLGSRKRRWHGKRWDWLSVGFVAAGQ